MRLLSAIILLSIAQSLYAQQTRIAIGSCTSIKFPQPIWTAIANQKPDLFISLGDIVYSDTENMDEMRAAYANMDTVSSFQKLRTVCPVVGIWDDHDYGEGDGGASYPKREEVQKIFLDFLGESRDSKRRKPLVFTM